MANPIQQGLKHYGQDIHDKALWPAMANPIQQGLKPSGCGAVGEGVAARNG